MTIETIVVGALQVNCYLLCSESTGIAMVIDPGDEPDVILAAAKARDCRIAQLILTHAHFDHLLAARALQTETGAPLLMAAADRPVLQGQRGTTQAWLGFDPGEPPVVDGDLVAGEQISAGEIVLEVLATPGHSPGGVSLIDHAHRVAFTGDSLFAGSIGRTDLPGGSLETLLASIRDQLLTLPDDYAVLPGHGPSSTVGEERRSNPFLMESTGLRRRR